ncbi:hypothetical protein EVAR_39652_1 [Eumeta japonica]|uniref:Uncharacterized protein n=1 Tax=Eumeta variegata TaxID=151549 RepID=A0A4C1WG71_EUMVA|nr:hypothetical protein EVAR_39652_1 [Eumeta japonica]
MAPVGAEVRARRYQVRTNGPVTCELSYKYRTRRSFYILLDLSSDRRLAVANEFWIVLCADDVQHRLEIPIPHTRPSVSRLAFAREYRLAGSHNWTLARDVRVRAACNPPLTLESVLQLRLLKRRIEY